MPKGSSKPRWLEIDNGTHQLLVYANDVNILGGSLHTVRKNTSKEISLKTNAYKTKYAVMS
jgi:hypothetical protein